MCEVLEHPNLMSGWGCCHCRTYNGLWRDDCKFCNEPHCPLPDGDGALEPRAQEEA